LPMPSGLEGTSMAPLLDEPELSWKRAAFTQFPRPAYYKKSYDVMGYAIRTERFHYIEWIDVNKKQPVTIELYDHKTDPYELTNIALKQEQQPTIKKLSQLLKDGWKAALPVRR